MNKKKLVIFGAGNFVSDIFDAALALGLEPAKVVLHLDPGHGERDVALADRLDALARVCHRPKVLPVNEFVPGADECYVLGITSPARDGLVEQVVTRFGIAFCNLLHPAAHVSPLASLGAGVFVGAGCVVAAGARLGDHVVVNRTASVGHDTEVGEYTRVQPGATLCGLIRIGRKATIGAGATVIERLRIGDAAVVAAGAVVVGDVAAHTLVAGVPARWLKDLA